MYNARRHRGRTLFAGWLERQATPGWAERPAWHAPSPRQSSTATATAPHPRICPPVHLLLAQRGGLGRRKLHERAALGLSIGPVHDELHACDLCRREPGVLAAATSAPPCMRVRHARPQALLHCP